MRILHLLAFMRADIGGPARAVTDLCAALARRGHEVTLCTWDDSDVPESWRAGGAGMPRVVRIAPPSGPGGLLRAGEKERLGALIADHDLLHMHGVWNPWNWQLGALCRRMGKPYFISVRGMLDDWCMTQRSAKKRLFLALAARRWLEGAAAVHLTATAEHEQARKHFPRGRGIVIPNLLDLAPFRELPGPEAAHQKFPLLKNGNPNLLFLSRIHIKKGLEPLLHSAKLLRERGKPVNVLIAGDGEPAYIESLKALAASLGIADATAFVGQVVNREKLSLYQASDLFVLPTSQENFGFVFVESLACATPVITTRGVDIWPELESSGGAVITDAAPGTLADTLEGMFRRRDEWEQMGARGREWVFRALDPDHVIRQFEEMYRAGVAAGPR